MKKKTIQQVFNILPCQLVAKERENFLFHIENLQKGWKKELNKSTKVKVWCVRYKIFKISRQANRKRTRCKHLSQIN